MRTPRREARVAAFQGLYMLETGREDVADVLAFDWLEEGNPILNDEALTLMARTLLAGTRENIRAVDERIQANSPRWQLDRISKVDLSILRMAVFELVFSAERIPDRVVLDEAIEIAKEFGSDATYKFVNGVLDGIVKSRKSTV